MNSIEEREDRMTLMGEVVESNKSVFKVQVNENHLVTCKLGGKLRINDIRILVGDQVQIHVSPYNLNVGRIVHRIKSH